MPVIKLTQGDINEMVHQAVRSIMNESVSEVQGSALIGKDDVIDDLVKEICTTWAEIKKSGQKPEESYKWKSKKGAAGTGNRYQAKLPLGLTDRLGIARNFVIELVFDDSQVQEKDLAIFGVASRSCKGASYSGDEYNKYLRPAMKMMDGKIALIIPAINGELKTQGIYSTLYHELNHNITNLRLHQKHDYLDYDELDSLDLTTMSRRGENGPHETVQDNMDPDPLSDYFNSLRYGGDKEAFRMLNHMFYAVWEITEMNARVEGFYGELRGLGATRENFKEMYPKTKMYYELNQYHEFLERLKKVPGSSRVWDYASEIMGMMPRDSRWTNRRTEFSEFCKVVKKRYIKRTEELLDEMYRKAMKVAELYFERQEAKNREGAPPSIHDRINARSERMKAGKF